MIFSTKETIEKSHTRLLGIFLEIISTSIIILLLRTNLRDSWTIISSSIGKILDTLPETIALNKIEYELASEIETKEIYKYGLNGGPQLYKDVNCEQALGTIALLGSLTSFLQGDPQSKRIHLPGKDSLPSIWFFIEALRKFESDDFVGSLGMLMHGKKHTLSKEMGAQYHCLLGQTYSAMRERQKALDNYKKAIAAAKSFTLAHYCMGIECGKMGLHDSMLKSYQNLVIVSNSNFFPSQNVGSSNLTQQIQDQNQGSAIQFSPGPMIPPIEICLAFPKNAFFLAPEVPIYIAKKTREKNSSQCLINFC